MMNEAFYQAYMNGDADDCDVMDEYGEQFPDLLQIWMWVSEKCSEAHRENIDALHGNDDELIRFTSAKVMVLTHLVVQTCDEVFERIKTAEMDAEEKFARWSFLVETAL